MGHVEGGRSPTVLHAQSAGHGFRRSLTGVAGAIAAAAFLQQGVQPPATKLPQSGAPWRARGLGQKATRAAGHGESRSTMKRTIDSCSSRPAGRLPVWKGTGVLGRLGAQTPRQQPPRKPQSTQRAGVEVSWSSRTGRQFLQSSGSQEPPSTTSEPSTQGFEAKPWRSWGENR